MARRGPKEMTKEHKAAMAAGRTEGRAVKNYLEALEENRPRRGRKRTPESIEQRLEKIESDLPTAEPMARLAMIQERIDLEAELKRLDVDVDISQFEADFVAAAKAYSDRKGISYRAWRQMGVDASVLSAAGISRSS